MMRKQRDRTGLEGGPLKPTQGEVTYAALVAELRQRILEGIYDNAQLPTHEQIVEGEGLLRPPGRPILKASKWVVRKAYDTLADEGLLDKRGRNGTWVKPAGRARRGTPVRTVAILQNAVPYDFMTRLTRGIINRLYERNRGLPLREHFHLLSASSEDDPAREGSLIRELVQSQAIDGLMVLPTRSKSDEHDREAFELASKVPTVLVGAGIHALATIENRIPIVTHDDELAGRRLAQVVLSELGFSHLIGSAESVPIYLFSEDSYTAVVDRAEAFGREMRSVFKDRWLGPHSESVGKNHHYTEERRQDAGRVLARRLMRHGLLGRGERRAVIVCTTDLVAVGALGELQSPSVENATLQPLRVPEDVMVIGLDGEAFGKYTTPRLCSLPIDHEALGRLAVDILVRMILENYIPPYKVLLPPEMPFSLEPGSSAARRSGGEAG